MKRLPDERIAHYWDGQDKLVEEYKSILPTKEISQKESCQLGANFREQALGNFSASSLVITWPS
jgi:hypothetical protein